MTTLSSGIVEERHEYLLVVFLRYLSNSPDTIDSSRKILPQKYLGFLGTLFLFVATAGLCTVIPGFQPPTASLSTTAALALSVFVAVPFFGIEEQGLGEYLKSYTKPTVPSMRGRSGSPRNWRMPTKKKPKPKRRATTSSTKTRSLTSNARRS